MKVQIMQMISNTIMLLSTNMEMRMETAATVELTMGLHKEIKLPKALETLNARSASVS